MTAMAMADPGYSKAERSMSLVEIGKFAVAIAAIIGAFYTIVSGVKDNINTEARALKESIVAESKVNSGSIYNLQVDLAVTKNRLDQAAAELKQVREDDRQRSSEIKATLDNISASLRKLEITMAGYDTTRPSKR